LIKQSLGRSTQQASQKRGYKKKMVVDFSGKVDWASRANFEVDKRMLELGDKIRDAVIAKLMNELWYPPSEANRRLSAGRVLLRAQILAKYELPR
jgi:hypothetical protein